MCGGSRRNYPPKDNSPTLFPFLITGNHLGTSPIFIFHVFPSQVIQNHDCPVVGHWCLLASVFMANGSAQFMAICSVTV